MKIPKFNWIPFDSNNPPTGLVFDEYLILLREKFCKDDTWLYSVDVACPYGTYIDNFWDTDNDWKDGQAIVEVVAYAEIPAYLTKDEIFY